MPRGNYPGQYYVSWGRLPEGHYTARVAGIEKNEVSGMIAFDVQGNLTERLDVHAQPSLMNFLADQSGGAVLEKFDPALLARQFERHLSQSRPTTHLADHGLGSLVGIAGNLWTLGRRVEFSPPLRSCVKEWKI